MGFETINDSFCPIMSAGASKFEKCNKNCQWYNPKANNCDINILADFILNTSEIQELRKQEK